MAPFQLHEVVAVPSPVLYAHVPTRLGAIVAVVINVVPAVGAAVVAVTYGIQAMFAEPPA
jgi:hypothetical protein